MWQSSEEMRFCWIVYCFWKRLDHFPLRADGFRSGIEFFAEIFSFFYPYFKVSFPSLERSSVCVHGRYVSGVKSEPQRERRIFNGFWWEPKALISLCQLCCLQSILRVSQNWAFLVFWVVGSLLEDLVSFWFSCLSMHRVCLYSGFDWGHARGQYCSAHHRLLLGSGGKLALLLSIKTVLSSGSNLFRWPAQSLSLPFPQWETWRHLSSLPGIALGIVTSHAAGLKWTALVKSGVRVWIRERINIY